MLQKPFDTGFYFDVAQGFTPVSLFDASTDGGTKVKILLDRSQRGFLYQFLGVSATVVGDSRKMRFLFGGEMYFHSLNLPDVPRNQLRLRRRIPNHLHMENNLKVLIFPSRRQLTEYVAQRSGIGEDAPGGLRAELFDARRNNDQIAGRRIANAADQAVVV